MQVSRWRERYAVARLASIERDLPRGAPRRRRFGKFLVLEGYPVGQGKPKMSAIGAAIFKPAHLCFGAVPTPGQP